MRILPSSYTVYLNTEYLGASGIKNNFTIAEDQVDDMQKALRLTITKNSEDWVC